MRIFVSLDLPSKVKDYLFDLQSKMKTPLAKVNWVAKKNIHLTLKFFGDMSEEDLEKLKLKLKGVKFSSLEVSLDSIGVFPNESNIRIAWIGLSPEEDLIKLQQEIDSETLDVSSLEQRFRAHLTLGRVKWVKNKPQYLKFLSEIKIKNLKFKVDKFYLYNSELSKDGPKYERLEEY